MAETCAVWELYRFLHCINGSVFYVASSCAASYSVIPWSETLVTPPSLSSLVLFTMRWQDFRTTLCFILTEACLRIWPLISKLLVYCVNRHASVKANHSFIRQLQEKNHFLFFTVWLVQALAPHSLIVCHDRYCYHKAGHYRPAERVQLYVFLVRVELLFCCSERGFFLNKPLLPKWDSEVWLLAGGTLYAKEAENLHCEIRGSSEGKKKTTESERSST